MRVVVWGPFAVYIQRGIQKGIQGLLRLAMASTLVAMASNASTLVARLAKAQLLGLLSSPISQKSRAGGTWIWRFAEDEFYSW